MSEHGPIKAVRLRLDVRIQLPRRTSPEVLSLVNRLEAASNYLRGALADPTEADGIMLGDVTRSMEDLVAVVRRARACTNGSER